MGATEERKTSVRRKSAKNTQTSQIPENSEDWKPKYFRPRQYRLLKKACKTLEEEMVVRLGCRFMLRVNELRQLRVEDFRFIKDDDGTKLNLNIRNEISKRKQGGGFAIDEQELIFRFQQYLEEKKIKKGVIFRSNYGRGFKAYATSGMEYKFRTICKRVEVPKEDDFPPDLFHPHTLRHTGAIFNVLLNKNPIIIMQQGRWKNLDMLTNVYGKVVSVDALQKIDSTIW